MIALLAFVAGMVIGGLLVHYLTPAEVAKVEADVEADVKKVEAKL